MRTPVLLAWSIMSVALPLSAAAAETPASAGSIDYLKQVKPIFMERCAACHGALKQKGGLRLDAAPLLRKGGDNGAVVSPRKSDESLLIYAVTGTHDVERMPKEGAPLTDEQVATLKAWIDQGAIAPDEPTPPDPRDHWSFRPPVRPPLPVVKNQSWARNPIDAFIAAGHDRHGLHPRPEAGKATLLRRIYLDLIGLPPTRAELRAFLADDAPDAYERVVDELLASPRYGERWGRHWMDVWRYSDWAGYQMEVRDSQPFLWRWRDWIVESLNADKPYDRMVTEMLAGDELAPADPQTLRATGYLVRSWYKFNRNVWMENTVEHTSKAFLGLTLSCAKCHDHKYDPLAQRDYYRFRAFFEPTNLRTDRVPGEPDTKKDGLSRIFDEKLDAPTYLFARGDEKSPDAEYPLAPATPPVLGGTLKVEPVALAPEAWNPSLQTFVAEDLLAAARAEVNNARAGRAAADRAAVAAPASKATGKAAAVARAHATAAELELASVEARIEAECAKYAEPPDSNTTARALAAGAAERQAAAAKAEEAALIAEQQLAMAEAALKPGNDATKKAVEEKQRLLAEKRKAWERARTMASEATAVYTPLGAVYPKQSTGRRLALAKWIASRDNPLTARVAVNHIWMRHFGEPLVPTVFDFGLKGKPPTNPQLLDWLATELADRGWSMKALHRLIVTSATYRMDSHVAAEDAGNVKVDPDNHYLWRGTARRMEAEVVRDSILSVAGRLDLTAGGPDLDQNAALTSNRRSLYYRHAHEKQAVFLQVFDAASPSECYRRAETILPQQALALANSPLSLAQSRLLAADLTKEVGPGTDEATLERFITAAFEQVLSRPPADAERRACAAFLSEQSSLLSDPGKLTPFASGDAARATVSADPAQRARANLVHVLLNHNDFVTVR